MYFSLINPFESLNFISLCDAVTHSYIFKIAGSSLSLPLVNIWDAEFLIFDFFFPSSVGSRGLVTNLRGQCLDQLIGYVSQLQMSKWP